MFPFTRSSSKGLFAFKVLLFFLEELGCLLAENGQSQETTDDKNDQQDEPIPPLVAIIDFRRIQKLFAIVGRVVTVFIFGD